MDSFEVNKVAGAVLGTLLFAFGTGFVAELIYHPKPAGKAGYDLPEKKPADRKGKAGGEQPAESIAALLASADAEKGKGAIKPCAGCHSFEKGGPDMMGPGLWEIVDRKKAGHAGFDYSAALKEKGGNWTYDDLDKFLLKPSDFAKGTKMAFQGISSGKDRANLIAYLRTLSDDPKPLPAAEKKEEGKPAEGGTKPAEGGAKPEEAKPAAEKSADPKPAEGEAKPEEAKPAAEKPADPKPAEGEAKPEEAKPAEQPTADKPAEPKPDGEGKPADP